MLNKNFEYLDDTLGKKKTRDFFVKEAKKEGLYEIIKNNLMRNNPLSYEQLQHRILLEVYSCAIDVILKTKAPKIELKTVLPLFYKHDSESFHYFILQVVIKQNPPSLKNSPLKTLIHAIAG